MIDNGDELGRVYGLVLDAVNELMTDIGQHGTARRLAYWLLAEMKPILEAVRKAASDHMARGADTASFYAVLLDHMQALPGKLREL